MPVCALGLLLLELTTTACSAASKWISVDTGECGGEAAEPISQFKSEIFEDKVHQFRAYGLIEYRHNAADEKLSRCHVVYRLFVSVRNKVFNEVKELAWDTESGEIAGIDLVGSSRDGAKFGADFWSAEGDGTEHRPLVFDLRSGSVAFKPLEDRIQKRIHGCDQDEDFVGVTNSGEAIFAVPPSNYDDSSDCGDKGLWHFNLATGAVKRVARFSGDKWK